MRAKGIQIKEETVKTGASKEDIFEKSLLLSLLAGLLICGASLHPNFLKLENLLNLTRIISIVGVMAIGVTFVLLVGEIDLSVGSIMSLSAVVGGHYLHLGIAPVLIITYSMGLLLGLVNGIGVVKGKIPSLIMTLGTLIGYQGLANIISGGKAVYPYRLPLYIWIGKGSIIGIPFPIIIFAGITAVSAVVLNFTKFGRAVYYTGANAKASRYSGVNTDKVKIITFLLSGLFASLAGPMVSGQINRIWPTQGSGYELTAISIAVLGGTSLLGGRGTVSGTVIAALILGGLMNLLNLTGVGTYLQEVVKGALLISIVGITQLRTRRF